MFPNFLDRVGTATLLYVPIAWYCWQLQDRLFVLLSVLLPATYWIVRVYLEAIHNERVLDSLGSRAPSVRTWTPWNIGFKLRALFYLTQQRNEEFWSGAVSYNHNQYHDQTVEVIVTGVRVMITLDEDNIKAILATQFADYGKGVKFREEWKQFLGLSVFTTDGEVWHNSRNLLRPSFIKDRVSNLDVFEKHIDTLLPMLQGVRTGTTVRIDDLLHRYTLDAATDFLFGKSVDCLVGGDTDFAHAFADLQRIQSLIVRAGKVAILLNRKTFHRSLAILNNFVEQYVEQALRYTPDELENFTKYDQGYTFLYELAKYTRDPQVLRDQLVSVLIAGRDTTATTLSWLFYELSRNPEIVAKLRDEIHSVVGDDRHPTYADIKSLRYLSHTLNETLRLYPAVPYNVRVALKDTTLPCGGGKDGTEPIAIQKGTPIGYSAFLLHRRANLYPPASEKHPHHLAFAPERWDSWTPRLWTYIPFNGGPRICIGQQFALTEMAYTVVRILQTYTRIESRQEGFPGFKSDIVLQPAKGVRVAFFKE